MRWFIIVIFVIGQCTKVSIQRIVTQVLQPIDAVTLPNKSLIIANTTQLFLFHPLTKAITSLSFDFIDSPIINIASLQNYVAIGTSKYIHLLFLSNLSLYQSTPLSQFKQYTHFTFTESLDGVFFIPTGQNDLQFTQYKWKEAVGRRFINGNNIKRIEYSSDHSFIFAGDETGKISIYNVTSKSKMIDSYQLCNSSVQRIQRVNRSEKVIIICDNASYVCHWDQKAFAFKQIEYEGYSSIAMSENNLFMMNSTHFLYKNDTLPPVIRQFSSISSIISLTLSPGDNNTLYALDDKGTLLLINISKTQDTDEPDDNSPWKIVIISSGGVIVLISVICLIIRFIRRRGKRESSRSRKNTYNTTEQSMLDSNLLERQEQQL